MRFSFNSRSGKQNPFVMALIGIILFLVSFGILWTNEGRINYANVARDSLAISADQVDPFADGQLVAAAGRLASEEHLADAPFFPPGAYALLERQVQMYAWVEDEDSDDDGTSYSYRKVWTSNPPDSSRFRHTANHHNPPMPFESQSFTVSAARVGAYAIDPRSIRFPDPATIDLASVQIPRDDRYRLDSNYIFMGQGSLTSPRIGDVRIQYAGVALDSNVTVFGRTSGEQIVPFLYQDKHLFYRMFHENREAAIVKLNQEYTLALWGFRVGGFMLMWIGLLMLFGPITALLNFVPVFGNLGKGLIALGSFVLALALTFVTVLVAIIAHNLLLMAAFLLLLAGGLIMWATIRRRDHIPAHT